MPEQRKSFHTELDAIRDDIVRLAAMLGQFIPRGTEALVTNDMHAAQQLIESDDEVDALTLHIEEQCYHVLALQQPMATDLRSIVTALWLTAEIERSADLMVNVAKGARRIYGAGLDARVAGLIERMAEESARLYRLAIDAYVERDAGLASALDDMDDTLDSLHNDYIEAIFESHAADNLDLQQAVQLSRTGR